MAQHHSLRNAGGARREKQRRQFVRRRWRSSNDARERRIWSHGTRRRHGRRRVGIGSWSSSGHRRMQASGLRRSTHATPRSHPGWTAVDWFRCRRERERRCLRPTARRRSWQCTRPNSETRRTTRSPGRYDATCRRSRSATVSARLKTSAYVQQASWQSAPPGVRQHVEQHPETARQESRNARRPGGATSRSGRALPNRRHRRVCLFESIRETLTAWETHFGTTRIAIEAGTTPSSGCRGDRRWRLLQLAGPPANAAGVAYVG